MKSRATRRGCEHLRGTMPFECREEAVSVALHIYHRVLDHRLEVNLQVSKLSQVEVGTRKHRSVHHVLKWKHLRFSHDDMWGLAQKGVSPTEEAWFASGAVLRCDLRCLGQALRHWMSWSFKIRRFAKSQNSKTSIFYGSKDERDTSMWNVMILRRDKAVHPLYREWRFVIKNPFRSALGCRLVCMGVPKGGLHSAGTIAFHNSLHIDASIDPAST